MFSNKQQASKQQAKSNLSMGWRTFLPAKHFIKIERYPKYVHIFLRKKHAKLCKLSTEISIQIERYLKYMYIFHDRIDASFSHFYSHFHRQNIQSKSNRTLSTCTFPFAKNIGFLAKFNTKISLQIERYLKYMHISHYTTQQNTQTKSNVTLSTCTFSFAKNMPNFAN